MFCPKCGIENPEGVQLCSSCGYNLSGISISPAAPAKTSGAAVAALILGVLAPFTCLLTTLPAIICGIVGLVNISKSRGQLKGNALAILGIVIPFAALPVIGIAAAITFPALSKTKMAAKQTACMTNMKELGLSMALYTTDHNNVWPDCDKWCDQVKPYLGRNAEKLFRCPSAKNAASSYAMNKNIKTITEIKSPATTVLLFESEPGWNQCGGPELVTTKNHCTKGCNITFCDGHVEFVKTKDIPNLKWTVDPNK